MIRYFNSSTSLIIHHLTFFIFKQAAYSRQHILDELLVAKWVTNRRWEPVTKERVLLTTFPHKKELSYPILHRGLNITRPWNLLIFSMRILYLHVCKWKIKRQTTRGKRQHWSSFDTKWSTTIFLKIMK